MTTMAYFHSCIASLDNPLSYRKKKQKKTKKKKHLPIFRVYCVCFPLFTYSMMIPWRNCRMWLNKQFCSWQIPVNVHWQLSTLQTGGLSVIRMNQRKWYFRGESSAHLKGIVQTSFQCWGRRYLMSLPLLFRGCSWKLSQDAQWN